MSVVRVGCDAISLCGQWTVRIDDPQHKRVTTLTRVTVETNAALCLGVVAAVVGVLPLSNRLFAHPKNAVIACHGTTSDFLHKVFTPV